MDNFKSIIKEQKSYYALTVTKSEEDYYILKYNEVINRHKYIYSTNKETGKDHFIRKYKLEPIVSHHSIKLNEVSNDDITQARLSKTPGFIYKKDGKLYYAAISSRLHFGEFKLGENMHHQCSYGHFDCKRFSPLPFSKGGCPKISDIRLRIERYNFVTDGYEVFNTNSNCMVVLKCTNYEQTSERKKDADSSNKAKELIHKMYLTYTLGKSEEIFPMSEVEQRKKYW
ncbi:MAG: hypothetical protein IKF97_05160 [Clostridia bacterium]|nr:hypothetical protein [Clostridia bacterium]